MNWWFKKKQSDVQTLFIWIAINKFGFCEIV